MMVHNIANVLKCHWIVYLKMGSVVNCVCVYIYMDEFYYKHFIDFFRLSYFQPTWALYHKICTTKQCMPRNTFNCFFWRKTKCVFLRSFNSSWFPLGRNTLQEFSVLAPAPHAFFLIHIYHPFTLKITY